MGNPTGALLRRELWLAGRRPLPHVLGALVALGLGLLPGALARASFAALAGQFPEEGVRAVVPVAHAAGSPGGMSDGQVVAWLAIAAGASLAALAAAVVAGWLAAGTIARDRRHQLLAPLLAAARGGGGLLVGRILAAAVPALLLSWLGSILGWGMGLVWAGTEAVPGPLPWSHWAAALVVAAPGGALLGAATGLATGAGNPWRGRLAATLLALPLGGFWVASMHHGALAGPGATIGLGAVLAVAAIALLPAAGRSAGGEAQLGGAAPAQRPAASR